MPNDSQDEQEPSLKIDEIDPEMATPEQVEELKKGYQTAMVQRGKWKDRAIDPETKKLFKDLLIESRSSVPQQPKSTPHAEPDEKIAGLTKTVGDLQLAEEKRQQGYRLNLSPEETDLAFQMAGNDPKKLDEIIKTDFFKAGLEGLRAKRRIEAGTPSPSSRSPMVGGKTFREMDSKERRAAFSKIVEAASRK